MQKGDVQAIRLPESPERTVRRVREYNRLVLEQGARELERKLKALVGVKHCLSVSSGTMGLILALQAAGVQPGEEVFCGGLAPRSVGQAVVFLGAYPATVDVNPNTFHIDPFCLGFALRRRIKAGLALPKAVVASDLFGLPCRHRQLQEICQEYGVSLIEELSQAFGGSRGGIKAGGFGRFAVASFEPTPDGAGISEGGAVFCRDTQDARLLEMLRHKMGKGSELGAVQAEVILCRLKGLERDQRCRTQVAHRCIESLKGMVRLQRQEEGCRNAFHCFVVSASDKKSRTRLIRALQGKKIPAESWQGVIAEEQEEEKEQIKLDRAMLTNTRLLLETLVVLPLHPYMTPRVTDEICRIIRAQG